MFFKRAINIINYYFDKPRKLSTTFLRKYGFFIPDKLYLSIYYRIKFGKKLDWENPKSFNEKLQWLKLYDRRPEYTVFCDKYRVRDYIAKTIGEEYLIPLLGVWDSPDDIDFGKLPNQFVLKCNHDSGGICFCKDKLKFDIKLAVKQLKNSLKNDYFFSGREWAYKNISRKIIAEKYMQEKDNDELTDYKFFCFNGEPKFLYVSSGLSYHPTARISFLTLDWNFAPFKRIDYKSFEELPIKPTHFNNMLYIARKLSKNIPFIRVDLYEIDNKVYFSELTFFPCGGLIEFEPSIYDLVLGSLIKLPQKK